MKKIILLLSMCLIINMVMAQGLELKIKIAKLANQELILGHHFNDRLIPDDTIKLNSKGEGTFVNKQNKPGGMYIIFLPNRNYFDILLDDNQKFSLETDTINFLENMKVVGSLENQLFFDYQKQMNECQSKYQELESQKQALKEKNKTSQIEELTNQQKELVNKVNQLFDNQIATYPKMFFSKFLKATRDVEIPQDINEPKLQYEYYKAHYFDNFDLSDPRLLRTALYESKVNNYIDKWCIQMPDSLIKECDMLIGKTRNTNDELFRFQLVNLFNKYAKSEAMVAENVYCHLAEIYAKEAKWDTDSFKTQLIKKVNRKKNCLVGHPAKQLEMHLLPKDTVKIEAIRRFIPAFKEKGVAFEEAKPDFEARRNDVVKLIADFMKNFPQTKKLSEVKSKYTILWFMEPDCSHCKTETPQFYNFFCDTIVKEYDVEVWCIYMNKSVDNFKTLAPHIGKWFDFVEKNHFTHEKWINLWNPFDQYRENYDINSTPSIFVLDQKKEIIAKRISFHQAYELIDMIEKNE